MATVKLGAATESGCDSFSFFVFIVIDFAAAIVVVVVGVVEI